MLDTDVFVYDKLKHSTVLRQLASVWVSNQKEEVVFSRVSPPAVMGVQYGPHTLYVYEHYSRFLPFRLVHATGKRGENCKAGVLTPDGKHLSLVELNLQAQIAEWADNWAREILAEVYGLRQKVEIEEGGEQDAS